MAEYYVVRDKNTGLYFRGKGVNRWGKYYNQASIYRIRANAENTIEEVSWRGEQAEVVPIQIFENTSDVVEVRHGHWIEVDDGVLIGDGKHLECSECHIWNQDRRKLNYCPHCGAKMDGRVIHNG